MSFARSPSTPTLRQNASGRPKKRGRSCVRRNTFDLDDPRAQINARLGDGETFESSDLNRKALVLTAERVQEQTAGLVRYSQGAISRVAVKCIQKLFNPKHGFDHWSGTNDAAGSVIAKAAGVSKRQWQRVKKQTNIFGVEFIHRSIKTGLPEARGVDRDLQVSDLYWFSPGKMIPWIKEVFDQVLAELTRTEAVNQQKSGQPPKRTPLVKRDRPHRRIPALLNPAGWARAIAAQARAHVTPLAAHAAREVEALAYASKLAQAGWSAA